MKGFAGLLLLLLGCNTGESYLSDHPTIVLDDAFSEYEKSQVLAGLEAWHTAVPELHLTDNVRIVRHGQLLLEADLYSNRDTVYIVRNEGVHDVCPQSSDGVGEGRVGHNHQAGDQDVICFDATYINAHEGLWRTSVTHEMGHALGLDHSPMPSAMAAAYTQDSDNPTPEDAARLRAKWNL